MNEPLGQEVGTEMHSGAPAPLAGFDVIAVYIQ
jgi:hypothetical protein